MLAFPGAEGFGANSVGGRGGTVYEVTNLDDSGLGSFREAVEASGARIVTFGISGTIILTSALQIDNPYITIMGQTAPDGGICLKGSGSWDGSLLTIANHNVIIRYVGLRIGAMTELSNSRDNLQIGGATPGITHDIILDHCSMSWSVDENVSTPYDPYNVTIQWCIISEALKSSTHEEGDHSMGMLLSGDGATNISVHHCLFVHNDQRHPRVSIGGTIDFVNNVIYNPGQVIGYFDNVPGNLFVNYVGNYIKKGGNSDDGDYEVNLADPTGGNTYSIYVSGNIGPNRLTDDLNENFVVHPDGRAYVTTTRNPAPLVTTISALEAYGQVLMNAGAILPVRDIADKRIVNDVINGTGNIINDPSEVGGWPDLSFSEWHGYLGIENMKLSGSQVTTLLNELKSIGPDSSYLFSQFLPSRVRHWRTRSDGDAAIFEALFNENNLTIEKFKQRLGSIFGVDPETIDHSTNQADFAGYGTPVVTFSRGGTDYLRFALFGGAGAAWMESGDECRGYLKSNQDEW